MAPSTESNRSLTMEDVSTTSCDRIRSGSISDSDNASMTIFVVEHNKKQQHLLFGVGQTDTVQTLKHKIADRRGIPLEQQRLVFGGKQLEDDLKLSDYKIRAQSCIYLDM